MKKKVIIDEIKHLLEVVCEETDTICSYDAYIPQIEMDIIMINTRNLYERFHELKQLNSLEAPVSRYVEAIEEKNSKEKQPEIIKEVSPLQEQKVTEKTFEMPLIVEKNIEETLFIEEPIMIDEKKKDMPVVEIKQKIDEEQDSESKDKKTVEKKSKLSKKTSGDLFSTSATLADKYKDENKSLNERFSVSEKNGKSIADKLHDKPINDLKSVIGINDKFKFINELFDGDLQLYNDCIAKLNGFSSFDEAGIYLDTMKTQNGWSNDNESFAKLTDMVIRRYLSI